MAYGFKLAGKDVSVHLPLEERRGGQGFPAGLAGLVPRLLPELVPMTSYLFGPDAALEVPAKELPDFVRRLDVALDAVRHQTTTAAFLSQLRTLAARGAVLGAALVGVPE